MITSSSAEITSDAPESKLSGRLMRKMIEQQAKAAKVAESAERIAQAYQDEQDEECNSGIDAEPLGLLEKLMQMIDAYMYVRR